MPNHPEDLSDTSKELVAVRGELHEVSGIVSGLARLSASEHKARGEAERTGHTPPPASISSTDLKLAIMEKCESCQKPGGAIYELATEVKGLAAEVKTVVTTMAEQRGSARVWAIGRAALGAVALTVLGLTLNHLAAKRSDDAVRKNADIAAEVARQLKAVETAAKGIHGALESAPACQFATVLK
jgi:hypothetical protein